MPPVSGDDPQRGGQSPAKPKKNKGGTAAKPNNATSIRRPNRGQTDDAAQGASSGRNAGQSPSRTAESRTARRNAAAAQRPDVQRAARNIVRRASVTSASALRQGTVPTRGGSAPAQYRTAPIYDNSPTPVYRSPTYRVGLAPVSVGGGSRAAVTSTFFAAPFAYAANFWSGVSGYGPNQIENARIIAEVGREMGMSPRDILIAIMTALQESTLQNLPYGDRDSLGLFQQRPSEGWGTPEQVTDPRYAARKFYTELRKVEGRENLSLTEAAQTVQRSAFPDAYAKRETDARAILKRINAGEAPSTGPTGPIAVGLNRGAQTISGTLPMQAYDKPLHASASPTEAVRQENAHRADEGIGTPVRLPNNVGRDTQTQRGLNTKRTIASQLQPPVPAEIDTPFLRQAGTPFGGANAGFIGYPTIGYRPSDVDTEPSGGGPAKPHRTGDVERTERLRRETARLQQETRELRQQGRESDARRRQYEREAERLNRQSRPDEPTPADVPKRQIPDNGSTKRERDRAQKRAQPQPRKGEGRLGGEPPIVSDETDPVQEIGPKSQVTPPDTSGEQSTLGAGESSSGLNAFRGGSSAGADVEDEETGITEGLDEAGTLDDSEVRDKPEGMSGLFWVAIGVGVLVVLLFWDKIKGSGAANARGTFQKFTEASGKIVNSGG